MDKKTGCEYNGEKNKKTGFWQVKREKGGIMAAKGKVLLIDDDDAIRFVAGMRLKEEGYDVEEAADAANGLEKLVRSNGELAGVISDLRMEGHNAGMWIVRVAKRMRPDLPVVLLTATIGLLSDPEMDQLQEMNVTVLEKDGLDVLKRAMGMLTRQPAVFSG